MLPVQSHYIRKMIHLTNVPVLFEWQTRPQPNMSSAGSTLCSIGMCLYGRLYCFRTDSISYRFIEYISLGYVYSTTTYDQSTLSFVLLVLHVSYIKSCSSSQRAVQLLYYKRSFRLGLELPSVVYITTKVSYRFTRCLLPHTHNVPSLSLLQVMY